MQCPNCNHPLEEKELPDILDELEPEEATNENTHKKPRKKMYKPSWILIGLIAFVLCSLLIFVLANGSLHPKERHDLFENGLFPVYVKDGEEGAWGYVNKKGEMAIDATFDAALPFSHKLAAVCIEEKWGYVNTSGEIVIEPTFDAAGEFARNGLAPVQKNGLWGYVNKKGTLVVNPQFNSAEAFGNESIALVSKDGAYGFVDSRGIYAIDPRFDAAHSFDSTGYAIVFAHGGWGMINKQGDFVINPQFDGFEEFSSNGIALVRKDGLYGYINRDGLYVVEPQYVYAEPYAQNGLALVATEEGRYGFINKKGDFVIDPTYAAARSFVGGIAAVCTDKENGVWHYVNKKGEPVTGDYEYAGNAEAGLALVYKESKCFYLNRHGEEVIALEQGLVGCRFHTDGYAIAIRTTDDGGDYSISIIDKKGNVICTVDGVGVEYIYYATGLY